MCGLKMLAIPKLQRCTVEFSELTSNVTPHFMMNVIIYPRGIKVKPAAWRLVSCGCEIY